MRKTAMDEIADMVAFARDVLELAERHGVRRGRPRKTEIVRVGAPRRGRKPKTNGSLSGFDEFVQQSE